MIYGKNSQDPLLVDSKTLCSYRYMSNEFVKLRGFMGNVGCVGAWLCRFVNSVGQIVAWVTRIAWVYKILAWVGVDPKFGVGPKLGVSLKFDVAQNIHART